MPTAIIVASIGNRPWFPITLRWMDRYARKCGYDLIICRQPAWQKGELPGLDRFQNYGRVQKLGIAKYFDLYDRLIQLDDTCLVSPGTPPLSEIVPAAAIGAYIEGAHTRNLEKYLLSHQGIYKRSDVLPADRFFNAGVCVFSRAHAALFDHARIKWAEIAADTAFPVQGYLSHEATELNLPYFALGHDYNLCGGPMKRLGGPEKAPKSTRIFHLTSALKPEERLDYAKRIDRMFTSLVAQSQPKRAAEGQNPRQRMN